MYFLPAIIVVTMFLGCDKVGVRDTPDTNHAQQDIQQTTKVNPPGGPAVPIAVPVPPPEPVPIVVDVPVPEVFPPRIGFGISHGGGAPGKSKRGSCPNLCEGFVFNIDFCEDPCEGFVVIDE